VHAVASNRGASSTTSGTTLCCYCCCCSCCCWSYYLHHDYQLQHAPLHLLPCFVGMSVTIFHGQRG